MTALLPALVPAAGQVGYTTTFQVLAILVVVAALMSVTIWALTAVLGRRPAPKTAPVGPSAPAPAVARAARTQGGHDPAHVAAIAAAVATVFDDTAVIVHIEPAVDEGSWANEVRNAHHLSHSPVVSRW